MCVKIYREDKMIRVCEPNIGIREFVNVNLALAGGWLTTGGKYCNEFEDALSKYCNSSYTVLTSSGTAALHLALLALGVGPGDEVIVPSLSFVAVASMTKLTGAEPVVVDVESDTWLIDPREVSRHINEKTKAIIIVDLYGTVCNVDNIRRVAPSIPIIIDACESFGAKRKSIGEIMCLSFQNTKIITTGEGGACITNSKEWSDKVRFLKDHAMNAERKYYHSSVGFNYRLTNIQAAIGMAQFRQLDSFLAKKEQISRWYRDLLSGAGVGFQKKHELGSQWVFPILVENRDFLMSCLRREGIESRIAFYPIHLQPPYENGCNCPASLRIYQHGLYLPSGTRLKYNEVKKVCNVIKRCKQ
jgi:perosamine synthetase